MTVARYLPVSGISTNGTKRSGEARTRSGSRPGIAAKRKCGELKARSQASIRRGSLRLWKAQAQSACARSRSVKAAVCPAAHTSAAARSVGCRKKAKRAARVSVAREGGQSTAQEGTGSGVRHWRRQLTRERSPPAQVLGVSTRCLFQGKSKKPSLVFRCFQGGEDNGTFLASMKSNSTQGDAPRLERPAYKKMNQNCRFWFTR